MQVLHIAGRMIYSAPDRKRPSGGTHRSALTVQLVGERYNDFVAAGVLRAALHRYLSKPAPAGSLRYASAYSRADGQTSSRLACDYMQTFYWI